MITSNYSKNIFRVGEYSSLIKMVFDALQIQDPVFIEWYLEVLGTMPVRVTCPPMDVVPPPPPPAKSKQPGVSRSLLYNGSKFKGHQKSKGNQYDVEVILQVKPFPLKMSLIFQYNSYGLMDKYELFFSMLI